MTIGDKIENYYRCPICNYYGPFITINPQAGERKHARCPKCSSLERHRLQYLVFKEITKGMNTKRMKMLHMAPEKCLGDIFKRAFKEYITANLNQEGVDFNEDLTGLSFEDNCFDFIYASHVLEHIKDDRLALAEIKRVLRPNGIAIMPVPVIGENTVEYNEPNPHDYGHVRCPGKDYYDKYKDFFSSVKLYKSNDFDEKYQVYVYEDRSKWPNGMPLRPRSQGDRHIDIVPVCYK